MGAFFKQLQRSTNKLSDLLGTVGGLLVIILMLLISFGSISRYGFGSAHGWITEISGYILLIITFLGAPQVQKRHGHVHVDLFVNMLKPKAQTSLNIVTSTISALLSLTLFGYGVLVTIKNVQENALLVGMIEVPKYLILWFVPLGFILLASYFIQDAIYHIKILTGSQENKPKEVI
ncbi:MAG: TRAP transporter small permease [Candidatus Amoebophilus sp.]